MKKFNDSQSMAISHDIGPCLVLAGPGSGKTTVLINRIINLIANLKVDPENILVITFTKAAATEMKDRFIKLFCDTKHRVNNFPSFGTFHSVFFGILRENFGYNVNSLIDENVYRQILVKVIEDYNEINITDANINNIISDIKEYKISIEKDTSFAPKFTSKKLFNKIYNDFEERLFYEKKLDFSDMINVCYKLLSEYKDVLKLYQDKYKYILIDEFQDINISQYKIIKLLCKNNNIFVVGDDDQSIYTFRGSHPRVMQDFLDDYKKARIIRLTQNYRCAKKIVYFSKSVIEENKDRFDKDLKSERDIIGCLNVKAFIDSKEENNYIIDKINEYFYKGIEYRDMAILYRTNLLSNSIKMSLSKASIPYIIKGEKYSLYDNFAVMDILSYLRLSINILDSEALIRVMNKPFRYINRDIVFHKNVNFDYFITYYRNKDYMLNILSKFKYNLKMIKNQVTALAIRYIRTEIGYNNYLFDYCKKHNIDYEEESDILDSLEDEAILYPNIKDYLYFINKEKEIDKKKINENDNQNFVNLMTFHTSKGLEFKVVFIIDANDGLIPHRKSIKANDIETERRLFYVGMTRAKDILHILFTVRRFGKNFKASRFILKAVGGQDGK